ncbi:cutinase-domain-containing protein [Mycena metata]|uniref:cutinase n=1 Tax=Mycena metata TaxID=1033252 RepID=A0AAD7JJI4_9AGAR|nr:cutinase-domain-containing protein [Mycena metata]
MFVLENPDMVSGRSIVDREYLGDGAYQPVPRRLLQPNFNSLLEYSLRPSGKSELTNSYWVDGEPGNQATAAAAASYAEGIQIKGIQNAPGVFYRRRKAVPVVEKRQACRDVIVIFARGTTEVAPIGSLVGPQFQAALEAALGCKTLTLTSVNYPASIAGFLEGDDPAGSTTMAQDLTSAAASPGAAIISSDYSQGGQLVHNSAKQLSASVAGLSTF